MQRQHIKRRTYERYENNPGILKKATREIGIRNIKVQRNSRNKNNEIASSDKKLIYNLGDLISLQLYCITRNLTNY